MLFDSKMPMMPSGLNAAGTVPNGCASRKALGLPQLHSFEAGSADLLARGLGFVGRRERPRVEVPEPGLELGGRRSADFDLDAA